MESEFNLLYQSFLVPSTKTLKLSSKKKKCKLKFNTFNFGKFILLFLPDLMINGTPAI